MAVSTERFLRGVKRRITMPANQSLLENSDILEMGDDCLKDVLFPIIVAAGQNYYVYYEETDLEQDVEKVTISPRYSVQGHREIKLSIDGTSTGIRDMTEILIEDAPKYQLAGTPIGYWYEGNKLVLRPVPNSDQMSLMTWFHLRPNRLVPTSEAALVASMSTSDDITMDIVVSNLPDTILTDVVVDFIQGVQGNSTLAMDKTVTGTGSLLINMAVDDVPDDLVAGDFICLSGESPVVQAPDEAFSTLEELTARRVLEAIGDFEGAKVLKEAEKELLENFRNMIIRRNKGALTKIVPRQDGLLRSRGVGFFNNRYIY